MKAYPGYCAFENNKYKDDKPHGDEPEEDPRPFGRR